VRNLFVIKVKTGAINRAKRPRMSEHRRKEQEKQQRENKHSQRHPHTHPQPT
jgi:hypothetical protein